MIVKTNDEAIQQLGCGRSTFYRLIKNARHVKKGRGGWDLQELKDALFRQGLKRGGVSVGGDGGVAVSRRLVVIKEAQAQEELELTRAKRMKAQQELAKEAGELLVKGDVLRGWSELMMNFRDALLIVGDQIALRCDGRRAREIAVIVREAHERILRELAEGGERVNGSIGLKAGAR